MVGAIAINAVLVLALATLSGRKPATSTLVSITLSAPSKGTVYSSTSSPSQPAGTTGSEMGTVSSYASSGHAAPRTSAAEHRTARARRTAITPDVEPGVLTGFDAPSGTGDGNCDPSGPETGSGIGTGNGNGTGIGNGIGTGIGIGTGTGNGNGNGTGNGIGTGRCSGGGGGGGTGTGTGRGFGHGIGLGDGGGVHAIADLPAPPPPPVSKARPAKLIHPTRQTEVDEAELFAAVVTVDTDGDVVGARMTRSHPGTRGDTASSMIWQFRYAPALDFDGEPVKSTFVQTFAVR